MSVPSLEPPARTARLRTSRVRTKTVSSRPAILVSSLRPHQYDLHPDCASLVCEDCKTWVPITGIHGTTPKLVPHHAGTAREAAPIRCSGSNRRVTIDVTHESWQRRLEQGVAETDGRRSTRITRKPRTAPAPAITHIAAQKQAEEKPGDGRALWLLREMQWASTAEAVRQADAKRAQRPAGDAPAESPAVPLTTLHPTR